jgi:hypothetical protein
MTRVNLYSDVEQDKLHIVPLKSEIRRCRCTRSKGKSVEVLSNVRLRGPQLETHFLRFIEHLLPELGSVATTESGPWIETQRTYS